MGLSLHDALMLYGLTHKADDKTLSDRHRSIYNMNDELIGRHDYESGWRMLRDEYGYKEQHQ